MPEIPRERALDSTAALFRDPYGYIMKRAARHGAPVFETRILMQPTLCMTGRDAAELFYDRALFTREGAAPTRLQKTLFGQGGVQGLDGAAHRARKSMLLSILRPPRVQALRDEVETVWRQQARAWAEREEVVLYDEMREVLARAVCAWAGLPLREEAVQERTDQLSNLYEGAGQVGPRHWQARRDRTLLESLLAARIEAVRQGDVVPPSESALAVVAHHPDEDGRPLEPRVAAVALLNLLRPTVAVSVYITFLAHALHAYPLARMRLGDDAYDAAFVDEVRRLYPFFPAVAAKTRTEFEWNGYRFPADRRVLLDLHGTNRDPDAWEDAESFRPERFLERSSDPFTLIPQGGGEPADGHRCAGEDVTTEIMRMALRMLHQGMQYEVPPQDLSIDPQRLPALPKSRFVVTHVRLKEAAPMEHMAR